MRAGVVAVAEDELDVVLLELQGFGHLLVGQGPVAVLVVQVVVAVLQEDADRLGRIGLANHDGVGVAAGFQVLAGLYPGETADPGENLAELFGPLPGDGEGADAAAARSGGRAAGRIVPQFGGLLDLRQDLFEQEPCVLVGERIVLEAAIAAASPAVLPPATLGSSSTSRRSA